jgi:hypothetical protein
MMNLLLTLRNKLGLAPRPALNSLPSVVEFTAKQSAYVSQVTLFGYIKTRAGTSWPKLFENDTYLISLRTARSHFFAACVSDLSLFFAARMFIEGQLSARQAEELAVEIAQQVLITPDIDGHEDIDPDAFRDIVKRTRQRALVMKWEEAATTALAFHSSAEAFMRWAPVTDEFKASDEEIMRNSLHLRWIGIRRDIKETLQIDPIKADLQLPPTG